MGGVEESGVVDRSRPDDQRLNEDADERSSSDGGSPSSAVDDARDGDEPTGRLSAVRSVPRGRSAGEDHRPLVGDGPDLSSVNLAEVVARCAALMRANSVERKDETIVRRFAETLTELLPGRCVVVQLLATDGRLSLVHATAPLHRDHQRNPRVSREALVGCGLPPAEVDARTFDVAEDYAPLIEGCSTGFDYALFHGRALVGTLGIEYAGESQPPDSDRLTVSYLGLLLAEALRTAWLQRESTYLKDYLDKLFDNTNAPILVISKAREIRLANRAFMALSGLDREDLIGRDFAMLLPASERSRLLPVFLNALRGDSVANLEVRIPRRSGGYARVAMNTAAIEGPDGEIDSVIGIGRDMTQVKALEEQVIQSEKLATLGQLAAGVVHELNNPLTSISVYSDYLLQKGRRDGSDPADIEKLRRITESAERILRFSRDLVTYARPSTEDPLPTGLHEALDQSMTFCEHVIVESGAEVERVYGATHDTVLAVKGQLHQVFINLIVNACHAIPPGAGKIVVETHDNPTHGVVIRISDNGAGIQATPVERIFEPFYSTKGEGKGTGLGLSIVRNLVRAHDGEIQVFSELAGGTTFELRFPGFRDGQ